MDNTGTPPPSAPATEASEAADDTLLDPTEQAAAPAAEAPKAAVAKAADKMDAEKIAGTKKYKIVVDGHEEEVSEQDLVKMAQKGQSSEKRFQESAQIKKEAAELIRLLRENPARVLADPAVLGGDEKVLEFAQKILQKKLEDEAKSPDIREKERLERELEQIREERRMEKEQFQQQEYQRLVAQHEAQLEEQIQDAIESSGLPKSPYILKKMADIMISALENDKEITPKQAINIAKREQQKDLRQHFDASPDEVLEELLGAENIKRLGKRQVARIKAEGQAPVSPNQVKDVKSTKEAPKKDQKISVRDWLRR